MLRGSWDTNNCHCTTLHFLYTLCERVSESKWFYHLKKSSKGMNDPAVHIRKNIFKAIWNTLRTSLKPPLCAIFFCIIAKTNWFRSPALCIKQNKKNPQWVDNLYFDRDKTEWEIHLFTWFRTTECMAKHVKVTCYEREVLTKYCSAWNLC